MNASFSRSQFPPNGWEFYQSQTGWHAPMPKAMTFDQTVIAIIKHRMQNGALVARHNLSLDPATVGNELENYTRARLGMDLMGAGVPKPNPQQPLPQAVVGAVEGLKRTAYGAAAPLEWLRSGREAVPSEQSARRAAVCTGGEGGEKCPCNGSPNLAQWFTVKAQQLLQLELERRLDLKLSTPFDENLGVCSACLCPMKLKVHTPTDIILKHMKPEVRKDLDPRCWILKGE